MWFRICRPVNAALVGADGAERVEVGKDPSAIDPSAIDLGVIVRHVERCSRAWIGLLFVAFQSPGQGAILGASVDVANSLIGADDITRHDDLDSAFI
jgi:hypothetical protein